MTHRRPTVIGIAIDGNDAMEGDDPVRKYVLWGNGRIDHLDGATPITSGPNFYARTDQPVAVAMWITSWTTGQGYILDYTGKFWPLNGAPALGTNGYVTGVPRSRGRQYVDWSWNPNGSGQGYVMDHHGQLYPFGGAPQPPRRGPRWGHPCARRLKMRWSPDVRALILDMYGNLAADFAAVKAAGGPSWPGWDAARDFVVTDWDNGRGYVLDLYGAYHAFGGAKRISGYSWKRGVDCGRRTWCIDVKRLIFWVIWEGGTQQEFEDPYPPLVVAGGGTYEQQQVTITGAPTGGTFTLTFGGSTTTGLARNASAATVQAALAALPSIGAGNVTVTGGGTFGTPWTVTFTGTLAFTDVAQMTATSSLSGGTSPAVTVTTLTVGIPAQAPAANTTDTMRPTLAWSYTDAINEQARWELLVYTKAFADARTMTDPAAHKAGALVDVSGTQPSQRGVVPTVDFANGSYVFYVRAQNKAGLWAPWSSYGWTQNVAPPPPPTNLQATTSGLAATVSPASFAVTLSVKATPGTGPGAADHVTFQYSEDDGSTWNQVRGLEEVPLAATVTAADTDIPLGVTRRYRAFAYKRSPRFTSAPSPTATATVTTLRYVLTATDDPSLGGEVTVVEPPQWTRPSDAGVFQGVAAKYPVVVSDGVPKARRQTLTVETDTRGQWELVEGLIDSDSTLLLRDPFGDAMYCRIAGDVGREQQRKPRRPEEITPWRHSHRVTLPLQEIEPPLVLDIGYTVPPGPDVP